MLNCAAKLKIDFSGQKITQKEDSEVFEKLFEYKIKATDVDQYRLWTYDVRNIWVRLIYIFKLRKSSLPRLKVSFS